MYLYAFEIHAGRRARWSSRAHLAETGFSGGGRRGITDGSFLIRLSIKGPRCEPAESDNRQSSPLYRGAFESAYKVAQAAGNESGVREAQRAVARLGVSLCPTGVYFSPPWRARGVDAPTSRGCS
ncbi:hypothetical protein KM043_009698 [Ampulex compressa]|nr:hypothetical protein KM043_009698 [Ampulex compressa]